MRIFLSFLLLIAFINLCYRPYLFYVDDVTLVLYSGACDFKQYKLNFCILVTYISSILN